MRVAVVLLVLSLGGCMVFSESMRRKHDDAGVDTSSSSSSSGGASCSVDAPAGGGAEGCGGTGGGTFSGDNVASGATIQRKEAACGSGKAKLSLDVQADDCLDVYLEGDTATASITAPDGTTKTAAGGGDIPFRITISGSLVIAISGDGAWKLVAH